MWFWRGRDDRIANTARLASLAPVMAQRQKDVPAASRPVSLRGAFACVNSARWPLPPTGAARRGPGLRPPPPQAHIPFSVRHGAVPIADPKGIVDVSVLLFSKVSEHVKCKPVVKCFVVCTFYQAAGIEA